MNVEASAGSVLQGLPAAQWINNLVRELAMAKRWPPREAGR